MITRAESVGIPAMPPTSEQPTTSVLLLDGSENQRTYWADQLKRCSSYEILVA